MAKKNSGKISATKTPPSLRVAIVTPDYPPDSGGIAVSVQRVARSLSTLGAKVLVIVPRFTGYRSPKPKFTSDASGYFTIAHLYANDPNIEAANSCSFSGFGGFPQSYLLIKSLIQEWQPNVIHSFTLYPFATPCAIIARELHLPLVVGVRGSDITANIFIPSAMAYIKAALDNATVVAPVATQLGAFCKVVSPGIENHIVVVANGVEKPCIKPMRVRDLGAGTVQFGTVCIQRPKKNLDVLINAFIRLHRVHRNSQLVIVGPMLAEEKKGIAKMRLGRAITLTGKLESEKAHAAMAALDVFVIPSAFDGCANAMLEAMSYGLPIIASNVGGAMDFLKHDESALLFEPLDEDTLLRHMTSLLSGSERKRISSNHTHSLRNPEDEAHDWQKVYMMAFNKHRNRSLR